MRTLHVPPAHRRAAIVSLAALCLIGSTATVPVSGVTAHALAETRSASQCTPTTGNPIDAEIDPNDPSVRFFPQTDHTVAEPFLSFYNSLAKYGSGLKILGLPLTGKFCDYDPSNPGHAQIVQYFERARLYQKGGKVSITPLGQVFRDNAIDPNATGLFGPYPISAVFAKFWQQHGGSTIFGAPISEPFMETNGDGSGQPYKVQYFANGRLEYHPTYVAPYQIEIGLIGLQYVKSKGWE